MQSPNKTLIVALLLVMVGISPPAAAQMKEYQTRYYTIYTDLDPIHAAEAQVRIERMAEAYHRRTSGFGGQITQKLPFYLFTRSEDYYQAGGLPGSAGMFNGRQLMAISGKTPSRSTWRVMQHEGFHQFVHAVVGGNFPIWVNEGMAEYFAEAEWTGDGYVTGIVPPERLARLRQWIESGNTISISDMMRMPHALWNAQMNIVNYDQAWSMIYFLAHAEDGRYQRALNGFIRQVSRGGAWEEAWRSNFGGGRSSIRAFENRWREYWLAMPPDPTADKRIEATMAKLTSFYARAFTQRQVYTTFDDFIAAAKGGKLRHERRDWLPDSLLKEALSDYAALGAWRVHRVPGRYELQCRPGSEEGVCVGSFTIGSNRVRAVEVTWRRR